MEYSVIIPSKRQNQKLYNLLDCIKKQTVLPKIIFLLIDSKLDQYEFKKIDEKIKKQYQNKLKINIISNFNSNFVSGNGVSYVRNYGIDLIDTHLLMTIDDDNTISENFAQNMIQTCKELYKDYTYCMIIPTEIYKGKIRSMGYSKFLFRFGRQKKINIKENKFIKTKNDNLFKIKFSSSNCIFGFTKVFQTIRFDERMKFVYEDFDFTYKATKKGYSLFVSQNIKTNHNMKNKTKLENLYIADEHGYGIYQKSKNRILFVKSNGSFIQKILYFLLGLHIHNIYLLYHIFFYSKNKLTLSKKLFLGIIDGIKG